MPNWLTVALTQRASIPDAAAQKKCGTSRALQNCPHAMHPQADLLRSWGIGGQVSMESSVPPIVIEHRALMQLPESIEQRNLT
jgi:hypothetical protein